MAWHCNQEMGNSFFRLLIFQPYSHYDHLTRILIPGKEQLIRILRVYGPDGCIYLKEVRVILLGMKKPGLKPT